ncbi:DEAD/DEAH box helicase [Aliiroseovarius sp.]|uniref:DEAD/DEAH box helicase n=1 Tax=Aliiroseovarius sp. TaxID=1872442 RepID=UPI002620EAB7|nr:DEAD/DEAH box helicase [Aliiroseovarius sp.]
MKTALSAALAAQGYDTLTQVQEAVTAPELAEADLLVSAQTGSGKTVGFGLAIAPTLLGDDEAFGRSGAPLGLVIAPTRELAMQVRRELTWLYREAGAYLASCVGGMDQRDERRALERGTHIVVATPGRLRDHIERGAIDLSAIRAVVLDEADEMLDMGFREDLEFILSSVPEDRRTLLFSATVPPAIAKMAKNFQRDSVRIKTVAEATQHADIDYHALSVMPRDAEKAIINVLRYHEAPNAIVFANTRAMVARLTARLSNRGLNVVSLSGELSQSERTNALQAMRDGRAQICVATDVAARGIDLPKLDLVVHAELPSNHETLLHRSGRTGRAGRKGVSALIVPPSAYKKAQRLLSWAKVQADWGPAPSAEAVLARDSERMMADPAWSEPVSEGEAGPVAELVDRFGAEQLAAAYLRLYRGQHSAPEELGEVTQSGPRPTRDFGPSVWFSISGGREAGAEVRRIMPMLCKAGNITKDEIGAIRIQDTETFVEIAERALEGFIKALDGRMEIETGSELTRLDKPPVLQGGKPGFKGKPRHEKKPHRGQGGPRDGKPKWDKPRGDKPKWGGKARDEKSRFEKPSKPKSSPTNWDDEAAPRKKKPKGQPKGGAPKHRGPREDRHEGAVSERKPRHKPEGKPGQKATEKPKGPPPPKGKPNSKKNKARAAAAKAEKSGKGGNAVPRRTKG